jgi:alanine-synthesizing transaminase
VADEVFADYAFAPDDERVVSHAGISEALTFTLSGLSKISALPQMKLAWVVVNGAPDLLPKALARLEVIADTYLSVSAPLALALPTMLETRRSLQPQILERVRTNLHWLDEQLAADLPVGRLKADGGSYAILRLPAIRSDEDWALELLAEDGVLVHPGHFYDFPLEGHLVISLLPPAEIFQQGIRKLLARVSRHG